MSNLSYFDKNTLSQFITISDNSLYANINRWLKSGKLLQLKKGCYVTSDYITSLKNQDAYREFIANKLREPSYLSLEYVLQKYGILSESVYGLTSVTLKSKRTYQNKFGVFIYRNIKQELFDGYRLTTINGFSVKTATQAKALFDYFYYKLFRIKEVNEPLIATFRLNFDGFSKKDLEEFAHYCQVSKTKKMGMLIEMIKGMM